MDIISPEGLSAILPIIFSIIGFLAAFWEKISKTKLFLKIRTNFNIYYLYGMERKFLVLCSVCGVIAISSFAIAGYSYFFIPHQNFETHDYVSHPWDLAGSTKGGIYSVYSLVPYKDAMLIDRNQIFGWGRWNENAKLKKIILNYSTQGTIMRISAYTNKTDYTLTGTSTLDIEDISIPYSNGTFFAISIMNIGDAPFYLFSIETVVETQSENKQPPQLFFIGIFFSGFAYFYYTKDKDRKVTAKPLDLLYEDAKYVDKIKNIEIELKTYQDMLKYLEGLKEQGKISEKYYADKKSHFENYLIKLNEETEEINSEIEDIINNFKT